MMVEVGEALLEASQVAEGGQRDAFLGDCEKYLVSIRST